MSLVLERSSPPISVDSKSLLFSNTVSFGDQDVDLHDFLAAAEYVLINTDLRPNDPRLVFIERVKQYREVPGYQRGGKRLGTT